MRRISTFLILSSLLLADPLPEMIWMVGSKPDHLYVGIGTMVFLRYAKTFEIPVLPADPILGMTECDPVLLKAMMRNESNFRIHATSPTGALGVSQFVRSTAKWLRLKNPYNPISSTFAMCRYVSYLSEKFKSTEEILWAYHDGEGAVKKRGPSEAAKGYARTILSFYRDYKSSGKWEWFKDKVVLGIEAEYIPPVSYDLEVFGAFSVLGSLDLKGGYEISSRGSGTVIGAYLRIFHDLALAFRWDYSGLSFGTSLWDIDRGLEVLVSPRRGMARLMYEDFGVEMDEGRVAVFYRIGL